MTEEQNSPSGENRTRVSRLAGEEVEGSEELARQGGSNNPKGGAEQKRRERKFQENQRPQRTRTTTGRDDESRLMVYPDRMLRINILSACLCHTHCHQVLGLP
jgi:hypothetical protein